MQGLEVWNDQVLIRVFRGGRLAFRAMPDGDFEGHYELQEGRVEAPGTAPVTGLLHYALPCIHERVVVRVEGVAVPLLDRAVGEWPAAVDDDQLETYPHLHFLEERKTGMPWRFERWYTIAGPYLVFDSEQYFERQRVVERGKNWERLILQLRQVVDLSAGERSAQTTVERLVVHAQ
ncbi:MAG: hypothetical protein AMJ93_02865 [Anaerolineae bacterium SM23_84]|nr:MAG: hypothetical protein AMJ93_02865 [Anaerolineae bacterium SM23_84]